jgi:hypothetical protein
MNNEEIITVDFIIGTMQKYVESKTPIPPSMWLDAAAKLNVLLGEEHDKLFDLESTLAQMRTAHIEEGKNGVVMKALVEATPEYNEMRKQKGKISRIEEFIRIAKLTARTTNEEIRGY